MIVNQQYKPRILLAVSALSCLCAFLTISRLNRPQTSTIVLSPLGGGKVVASDGSTVVHVDCELRTTTAAHFPQAGVVTAITTPTTTALAIATLGRRPLVNVMTGGQAVQLEAPDTVVGIAMHNNRVFIACETAGFFQADTSDRRPSFTELAPRKWNGHQISKAYAVSDEGLFLCIDLSNGQGSLVNVGMTLEHPELPSCTKPMMVTRCSTSSRRLFAANDDGTIVEIDTGSGACRRLHTLTEPAREVSISPDEQCLAVVLDESVLILGVDDTHAGTLGFSVLRDNVNSSAWLDATCLILSSRDAVRNKTIVSSWRVDIRSHAAILHEELVW